MHCKHGLNVQFVIIIIELKPKGFKKSKRIKQKLYIFKPAKINVSTPSNNTSRGRATPTNESNSDPAISSKKHSNTTELANDTPKTSNSSKRSSQSSQSSISLDQAIKDSSDQSNQAQSAGDNLLSIKEEIIDYGDTTAATTKTTATVEQGKIQQNEQLEVGDNNVFDVVEPKVKKISISDDDASENSAPGDFSSHSLEEFSTKGAAATTTALPSTLSSSSLLPPPPPPPSQPQPPPVIANLIEQFDAPLAKKQSPNRRRSSVRPEQKPEDLGIVDNEKKTTACLEASVINKENQSETIIDVVVSKKSSELSTVPLFSDEGILYKFISCFHIL